VKNIIIVVGIIVSCLVLSCNKEPLTGEVSGNVFFTGTTIPVADVFIEVDGNRAYSDNNGRYLFRGPLGRFYLNAEKEGFDPYQSEIRIVQGNNNLDIFMNSKEYTCLIHGVVKGNHTMNPQAGMQIVILNPDDSQSELKTESDDHGDFNIQHVPKGERVIVVLSDGVVVFQLLLFLTEDRYNLDIYLPEPFTFIDERDGHTYWAIKIGLQTWMIENLAWLPEVYEPSDGAYDVAYYYVFGIDSDKLSEARTSDNYSHCGALYNWNAATKACPEGWKLPSDEDWQILELYLGMSAFDTYSDGGRLDGEIGRKMKSISGWNNNGNGDNSSKLNVLPVGGRFDTGGFDTYGERATFWTSTESSDVFSWGRGLAGNVYWVDRDRFDQRNGLSVRCLKNE